jgi:hypothetical protein
MADTENGKLEYPCFLFVFKNGQSRTTGKNWAHKTQDKDMQNTTQKTKKMSKADSAKKGKKKRE